MPAAPPPPGQEVLVVGAGPTGLTAAIELFRHGVTCRVVDASEGPALESRALAVHSRTLEILEGMGALPTLLERGLRLHHMNVYAGGKRIVNIALDEIDWGDAPYPFILSIPQSETERVLEERLAELGGRVERSVRLVACEQDDDRVSATLEHADGRAETVFCGWLFGCDGAHSLVRKTTGQEFSGSQYEERLLLADVAIDWTLRGDEGHIFVGPDGPFAAIPLPGEGRYRVIAQLPPESGDAFEPTLEWFNQAAIERQVQPCTIRDPLWMASFRIHRRMVERYRVGRFFLAGDAAHIHSPVGGQGMNTGIQDAYNLAWKLALVARGLAPESLLDSFQAERHPVAKQVLENTDAATRVVFLRHPVGQRIRNHLGGILTGFEVVQRRMARRLGQLTQDYRNSPAVGEHKASVLSARLTTSDVSEAPSVRSWLDFTHAPAPGDRAPDLRFLGASGEEVRLFELLLGTAHTLLLFDGGAATEHGYQNLVAIAAGLAPFGDRVVTHVIVPSATRPAALGDYEGSVVFDPESSLHYTYGAATECLYLVRPDGHIGFRAQPAALEPLMNYLARIFT